MNLAPKLTVLILTYNRYSRLTRLLKYINSLQPPFCFYILDSSSQAFDLTTLRTYFEKNSMQYFHFDPAITPIQKTYEGLQKVKTPYTVIWADDDFLVPGTLEAGIQFLDQNKDFCFVHGQAGIFQIERLNNVFSSDSVSLYGQRDIFGESGSERLLNHLNPYSCIFYSLYRTEILKRGLDLFFEYQFSFPFDEVFPSFIATIHGKGKKLDRLYMLRERHQEAGVAWRETTKGASISFEWVAFPSFANDCKKLVEVLGKEISSVDKIPLSEATKIAEQVSEKFLNRMIMRSKECGEFPSFASNIRRKLRRFKMIHSLWMYLRSFSWREQDRFLLPALQRKTSPYHQDFQAVYQCLVQK